MFVLLEKFDENLEKMLIIAEDFNLFETELDAQVRNPTIKNSLLKYTVKPVQDDHSWDHSKVVVL